MVTEELGKGQGANFKWCTNTCQQDKKTLVRIAQLLEVDMKELIRFENAVK